MLLERQLRQQKTADWENMFVNHTPGMEQYVSRPHEEPQVSKAADDTIPFK